jgi:hypothetical protein
MCTHSNVIKENKIVKIHVCLCIVHYALKKVVHNVNAKLTHNAKCAVNTHLGAFKENTIIKIHMCLCIMHYAFKESSKLCVMSTSSNEHARNLDAKLTHNTQ